MKTSADSPLIKLSDYEVPTYRAEKTSLVFQLFDEHALVTCEVKYSKNPEAKEALNSLSLMGDIELVELSLDGRVLPLSQLDYSSSHLNLTDLAQAFTLKIVTKSIPKEYCARRATVRVRCFVLSAKRRF